MAELVSVRAGKQALSVWCLIAGLKPIIDVCVEHLQIPYGPSIATIAIVLAGLGLLEKEKLKKIPPSVWVCLITFLLVGLTAVVASPFSLQRRVSYLFTAITPIIFLGADIASSKPALRAFVLGMVISCGILLAGAILQLMHFIPYPAQTADVLSNYGDLMRVSSFTKTAFFFCRYFLWSQILLILLLIDRPSRLSIRTLIILSFCLFLGEVILLQTAHRSSLLIVASIPILVPIVASATKGEKIWGRAALVAAIVLTAWIISGTIPGRKITIFQVLSLNTFWQPSNLDEEISQTTFIRGRSEIWKQSLEGLGQFSPQELLIGSQKYRPILADENPHNQLLDLLEIYGLVGTAAFLCLLLSCLFQLARGQAGALWSCLAFFLVYSLLFQPLSSPGWTIWLLFFPLIARHLLKGRGHADA